MNSRLKIDLEWLGRDVGSLVDRFFFADIGISIDGNYLTRLEDLLASTVRNHLRGNAYQLAVWFAANWWRLRWEPEIDDWTTNVDWRMSHSVASVGGGFAWPNIIFASDGASIAIASRPSEKYAATEPVQYLRRLDARISGADFEQSVDVFIEGVLSRLQSLNISDDLLLGLWKEVLYERGEPEVFERRKFEAICGYDPDEGPEEMLRMLLDNRTALGTSALEEIAAVGRHSTTAILTEILHLQHPQSIRIGGGFRAVLPDLNDLPQPTEVERPWQFAGRAANFARKQWGLGENPIDDQSLASLIDTDASVLRSRNKANVPMPLALQIKDTKSYDIFPSSAWRTSRRFTVARLIGDHLFIHAGDRLLPATNARTSRQQFQRAFAQEFLCPFDALLAEINTSRPSEDDIAEVADAFGVSELMVKTTLVNRGELDREALSAVY